MIMDGPNRIRWAGPGASIDRGTVRHALGFDADSTARDVGAKRLLPVPFRLGPRRSMSLPDKSAGLDRSSLLAGTALPQTHR